MYKIFEKKIILINIIYNSEYYKLENRCMSNFQITEYYLSNNFHVHIIQYYRMRIIYLLFVIIKNYNINNHWYFIIK